MRAPPSLVQLVEQVKRGDTRAIGRLVRAVDDGREGAEDAVDALACATPRPRVVGITGPPGAGKSSLVRRLTALWRADGPLGIVAVDPSSPFTGGAILGDRLRYAAEATEPGVHALSLAARGTLGGLSRSTEAAVRVLGAAGFGRVLVETVGVGQSELEVALLADVTCVVLVPGLGDDVQAMKAGLLEIADVFVVNKSDRPGARRLITELSAAAEHIEALRGRRPEIIATDALTGRGGAELSAAIARAPGRPLAERLPRRLQALAAERLRARLGHVDPAEWVAAVTRGELGLYAAARAWADAVCVPEGAPR